MSFVGLVPKSLKTAAAMKGRMRFEDERQDAPKLQL